MKELMETQEKKERAAPALISRADAKAQGLKRYFTGEPCKHGHVSERYVAGARCVECSRVMAYDRYAEAMKADPEAVKKRIRESVKRHYRNNKAALLEKKRAYYANNPELLKKRASDYRAKKKLEQQERAGA